MKVRGGPCTSIWEFRSSKGNIQDIENGNKPKVHLYVTCPIYRSTNQEMDFRSKILAVNRVMSYNIETKEFLQMPPLPFAILDMATVCIGEDVLMIGGKNLQGESLNTIFKYNHKTMQCTRLPSMRYR